MKYRSALMNAGLLIAASCFAQNVDTANLGALHWRLIGSFRGGRVSAVAGVPDNPNVYYFGTPGGGIWKTTDAGHVWRPIFDEEHVASIGALAVAPSDSKTIYAGTGEQTPGNGIYKSTDEGDTWTHAGLEDTRFIQAVIVDPHNPDIAIAGANSIGVYVFSRPAPTRTFSTARGVFKSDDGGKTWRQTLKNDETAGVFDLTDDPDNPSVLYASLYVPASGSKESGTEANSLIYKSTDEGSTWQPLATKGLPEKDRGRLGIVVAPGTNGQRIYAIMDQGFFRSDDGGATWTQSTKDPRILGSGYFSRIFVDTKNPDILYVAQTSLYRSTDGGRTFAAYVGAPSGDDFHVLWIDPDNPNRLFLGVDQGAIISVDAGKTWSSWYNQPTGQFYHVITDHAFPYRTYAAQQDSGTQSVPSRSDYGEITLQDTYSVGGFEFCFIAPDPLHPDWIYSGGWYGTVVRFDRKTGQTTTVFEKGDKYRVAQMPPLFFSPHDPHTLYLGTQYVLKTSDQGKTWQPISPDLTEWNHIDESEHNPDKPHPPSIEALAASTIDNGVMWAATTNRIVQLTRDGGAHWQNVTPPGLTAPSQILYVEPSHHDAARAYLTVGSSRQAVPPYILRTHDFGVTWQPIIAGLPANESVRVLREDPVRKGLLFAGTDSTVFISFDDGDHWHPLTLNLPATPVTDMEIHGDDLVISTYGRGLWILDDISPIRQLTPEVLASAVHLFAPATALRVRWDTNQDTPLPIETPAGKNPPDGIALDYYLNAPADDASITIRDASGNIVRRFISTPSEPKLPPANVPEYWFATPHGVDGSRGLHRFVWDLRYDAPTILPAGYYGPILQYTEYTLADHAIPHETPRQQPQGPLIVPGQYTVELTAGGHTVQQPLTVQLDPRVHATQQDLEAQLALARRILSGIQDSYSDYKEQKTLKVALEERGKTDPKDGANIEKQIEAVQDGTKAAPGMGPINRDLVRLLNSVESGDQHPTEPQIQAVDETCEALRKATNLWNALNENLQKQNPLNLPVATDPPAVGCAH
ncbi:MAG: glycoside hydrolase [Terracidiphilus sp.]